MKTQQFHLIHQKRKEKKGGGGRGYKDYQALVSLSLPLLFLQSTFSQPQMHVVADIDDLFLPVPDDLLVNLSECRSIVDSLLDSLPSMFETNQNVETALGPALNAAYSIMVL